MDEFGTMEDFDQLLNEVHKRDMKLIIDLVINFSYSLVFQYKVAYLS